jgi:arylsulfatase
VKGFANACLWALGAAIGGAGADDRATPLERAPILLIVIDTLSARHLSTYGYPLVTDPELARLAAESFVFERCFANAPWTVPSFMSLMTGLYGRAHELAPKGPNLWEQWYLAQNRWTLAEALQAAGYRTAGFVDNTFLTRAFGFAQGFDLYDESAAADSFDTHDDPEGGIRRTTALARSFLEGLPPDSSWFVFVHAFDVHSPYSARVPEEERARGTEPYDPERTAPAGGSNWTFGIVPTYVARGEVPEGKLPNPMCTAPIERAYDEGVRFADAELGKFLAHLRERRILERAWVVFTADHGETMADDVHLFGHGILSQDVMHVPLLIRPPGGRPAEERIAQTVQLADLYPTLLELAGVEQRPASHGRSLVPLLCGEERAPSVVLAETGITRQAMLVADGWKLVELEPDLDSPPEARISHPLLMEKLPALSELESRPRKRRGPLRWLDDPELLHDFLERMPAEGLTDELLAEMKTRPGYPTFQRFVDRVLRGPFYELYDLAADPGARHDVAAQHPERVAALRKLLKEEQRRRKQAWKLGERTAEPVLPPEAIRALEALGYGGASPEGE